MIRNGQIIEHMLEETQEVAVNELKEVGTCSKISRRFMFEVLMRNIDVEYLAEMLTYEVFKDLLRMGYTVEDANGNYVTDEEDQY